MYRSAYDESEFVGRPPEIGAQNVGRMVPADGPSTWSVSPCPVPHAMYHAVKMAPPGLQREAGRYDGAAWGLHVPECCQPPGHAIQRKALIECM